MPKAQTAPERKASGTRKLDSESKFCRTAQARCNALAKEGKLESTTREVWVVNDAADAVKSFIAKAENIERLDDLNCQLAAVQRGLNKFRSYLELPPMAV